MNNFKHMLFRTVVATALAIAFLAVPAFADDITLDMEGTTATIPKGNTVTRKIFGIPAFGGSLKMKFKWHAVHFVPNTFNTLKIVIKKGTSTVTTRNGCYSTHSNKTPKCDFNLNVSGDVADNSGAWTMEITNNSAYEVIGFDIRKGNDVNPLVGNFKSVYTPNCPNTVNLDLEGADTTTIPKGNTVTRKLFGIGKSAGVLKLRAKWHAVNVIPNTFNGLKIELLKPNGSVAVTGTYYSFHSNKSPKFDLTYNMNATDAALSGNWSLRITNNSNDETIGFNIVKGSDINPLVPSFTSTYKANCP